ncbi:MAG: hypothetical protein J6J74_03545 [Elusimicrobiaceae bacterium]|nr:hypothetical protein [Elusimicrobiaceae bacterium]
MKLLRQCIWKLQDRKAQILLPSVLLAPIFVLVIYLLFETAKVSMTKVRQQFALDNAAVSQMSAASTYLNAVAMVNGPLPYRVMLTEQQRLNQKNHNGSQISVFELFYKGGGVPTLAGANEVGEANPPSPESTDWGVQYYDGDLMEQSRKDWMKENPSVPSDEVAVISKKLVDEYHFPGEGVGVAAIVRYLETYARVGSIYKSQTYVYEELSRNAIMFREAYYLNVNDCKRSECARQSASTIRQYTNLKTTPFELEKIKFFVSDSTRKEDHHGGAYPVPFTASELLNGELLFQFAFLNSSSLGKLRSLSRGILLKQPYKLPRNHFNINLEQKYKPYVRNRVQLVCPRSDNNCVWPHPLPKYGITLDP